MLREEKSAADESRYTRMQEETEQNHFRFFLSVSICVHLWLIFFVFSSLRLCVSAVQILRIEIRPQVAT
jgi:hypothetical protein